MVSNDLQPEHNQHDTSEQVSAQTLGTETTPPTPLRDPETGLFVKGNRGGPGAPKGNLFRRSSGIHCALGQLPKGASWIAKYTGKLRNALEIAVFDLKGEVDVKDALLIQTAARNEQVALLCQRWLRQEHDALDHNMRLAYTREIAIASKRRDDAVDKLGLDGKAASIIDTLYGSRVVPEPDDDGGNDAS